VWFTETPNKVRNVNNDMNNNQYNLLRLQIRLVRSTMTRAIIGVVYWDSTSPASNGTCVSCCFEIMSHADNVSDTAYREQEILEEKNSTEYKELQKHPSNAKKEDVLKKLIWTALFSLYYQPSTKVYFHKYVGSYQHNSYCTFLQSTLYLATTSYSLWLN